MQFWDSFRSTCEMFRRARDLRAGAAGVLLKVLRDLAMSNSIRLRSDFDC